MAYLIFIYLFLTFYSIYKACKGLILNLLTSLNVNFLKCGQGNNADQLRPTLVPSFLGTRVKKIAAGLWHTLCVTITGQIYAFGGNQFGQLGTGSDQPEVCFR